jgi:hypothetical protein
MGRPGHPDKARKGRRSPVRGEPRIHRTARGLAGRRRVARFRKANYHPMSYNGLVQSWLEITRLAREGGRAAAQQAGLFDWRRLVSFLGILILSNVYLTEGHLCFTLPA